MISPVSWPTTANRSWPSASINATRSLARVPVSYPSRGLSVSPMPRWSTATTSKSRASSGICRRQAYQLSGQPCTSSSGGPSPPTTAWRRSSPVSTYRLANVSANPSGRFGAPETEPGPSGMGRWAEDELMRNPLSQHGWLTERPECGPDLLGEEFGFLPGGEVTALVDLVEVGEVGVGLLGPAARGRPDLAGKGGEAYRDRDLRRSLGGRGGSIGPVGLQVRPGRR